MNGNKKYIEVGALLDRMERRLRELREEYGDHDHYTDGYDEAITAIEDEKPAAVAEIVHCGECFYHDKFPRCTGRPDFYFCASGKRKGGVNNG